MSANTDSPRRGREFTGRHMAVAVASFFGVVIAANVVLAILANRSWSGLIVANGYVASQEYNGVLSDARAQAERGWSAEFIRRGGNVELRIADRYGAPVDGLEVHVELGRPTHENEDRDVILEQRSGGLYRSSLDLAPGEWNVALRAYDGSGLVFRRDIRLSVAGDATTVQ